MKVIITFTFCCDNLWESKFMALEKPGKLGGIFFSYFVATLLIVVPSVLCFCWFGIVKGVLVCKCPTPAVPEYYA